MINLTSVSWTRQARNVLSDLSFEICPGEILAVLGPSGSGKSSLLRLLAQLESPTSGTITCSRSLSCSLVWQSLALFPHMTVAANVGFGLRVRQTPSQTIANKVASLLELVHLSGMENRSVLTLSGGERQRVALARALAVEPDVLLLDEPLSALDATLRARLLNEIVMLHKRLNISTVMVTHDQNEAFSVADRVMVLNKGCIEQLGAPEEILTKPASGFVASFVPGKNILKGYISSVNGSWCQVKTLDGQIFSGRFAEWVDKRSEAGASCFYVVSQEHVRLGQDFSEVLKGEVVGHNRSMGHSFLDIATPTGLGFRLQVDGGQSVARGSQVPVSWRPADAYILPG